MNVSQLARQLNITVPELLEKLPGLGFAIGARAIKIDDRLVPKIIAAWKKSAKKELFKKELAQVEERGREIKSEKTESVRQINIGETVVVKDLAEMMKLPVAKLMGELMKNGIMVSLNEKIDFDTATIIAEDLGFKVLKSDQAAQEEIDKKAQLHELLAKRQAGDRKTPVVVVMGHVDHGKTKLLDAIRSTNIVDQEAGGITQHIGAYQVEIKGKTITFLDTPGHEAFKAMRSRGGQIADIAVLVVAADDGLQPQTLESIAVIQKENLPFIIALNKIDKEGADPERVKKQLAEINLMPEDWGGKTVICPISAKQKQGINELLDLILLLADLAELKADQKGLAVGTIIESHIDKSAGSVATVLVQAGTLQVGDMFLVGEVPGKIKILQDWTGQTVIKAGPATPVRILGLKQSPAVGEILQVVTDKKEFRDKLKQNAVRRGRSLALAAESPEKENGENILTLNLIVKADVLGSAEAIAEALSKIGTSEQRIKVIKKGLGQITESDILNAETAQALILGFHIRENKNVINLAEQKGVTILYFDVIYKLLEYIQDRLQNLKSHKTIHKFLGRMEVLAVFKTTKDGMIVGGKITEGKITKDSKIKIYKNGEVESIAQLINLQSARQNMNEVVAGNEAGIEFRGEPLVTVGDTLEFFEETHE